MNLFACVHVVLVLINDMHNSNRRLRQVTLSGEILPESKYCVAGFVLANVVHLKGDVWFKQLDSKQISSVEHFLESSGYA